MAETMVVNSQALNQKLKEMYSLLPPAFVAEPQAQKAAIASRY